MQKLKVIKTKQKSLKPDYDIYSSAITRAMKKSHTYIEQNKPEIWYMEEPESYKRFLFLVVRFCCQLKRSDRKAEFAPEMEHAMVSVVFNRMQYITPKELLQMFPVAKRYDGDKYQCKDYFFTMAEISKLDLDAPIGSEEAVNELLWDYCNHEINEFMVAWMMSISHLRQAQGGKNPMEEFLQKQGVPTYTYHQKEGYLYNRQTGEVTKVKKHKKRVPKYMKVVSSRMNGIHNGASQMPYLGLFR